MPSFVGIDLSKETFHAYLLSDHPNVGKAFPNSAKGFEQLVAWLRNRHAVDVGFCMEATGTYWEALAAYLHDFDQRVSVVNPARIKAFAQSELLRTKTDAVDAALIARFCKSQDPEPWIPPPPEIRALQALMRHYEHLKTTRAQQSVYAQSSEAAVVKSSVKEIIATLDGQIAEVEQKIRQHFDDHPDLKRRRNLLTSIPGIGETTAGSILSELPHLDRFQSAKAVAAFAGLSPRDRRSRTSVHGRPRLCKTGNARIRKALYMPAIVALRFNPTLRIFAERLLAAGKHKRLIIGAVMRKLLVLAYGVLRSGIA
jgi:transposase